MSSTFYTKLGLIVRQTGQALDRAGSALQGSLAYHERLLRHRSIMKLYNKSPAIGDGSWVAPDAAVIGDVTIGKNSSVWYGTVVRGDVNYIKIGDDTHILDRAVVHVAKISGKEATEIGSRVSIGSGAIVHACTIEDDSVIGTGATLLNGVVVEKGSMVAAGSVVTQGKRVPSGELWAGNPARKVRALSEAELAAAKSSVESQAELAKSHAAEWAKSAEDLELEKIQRKIALDDGFNY